jgi:hypothetical protein
MFMTRKELAEASGRVKAGAQIRWLDKQLGADGKRLFYRVDADGWPRITWDEYLSRSGSQAKKEPQLRLVG